MNMERPTNTNEVQRDALAQLGLGLPRVRR